MDGPGDALISQIIDDRVRILVTIMDFVDILDTRTKGSVVELCVESYEVSLVCPVEPMLDLTRLRELRRSNTILDGIDPQGGAQGDEQRPLADIGLTQQAIRDDGAQRVAYHDGWSRRQKGLHDLVHRLGDMRPVQ